MRWKRGLLITLGLLSLLALLAVGFWQTGGRSLVGLYFNYLSKDLPDKKYSREDFVERGDDTRISGYYGGRVGDNLFIWTLSGLKRYVHSEGKSVYYYMDTCGLIQSLAAEQAKSSTERVSHELIREYFFEPSVWDSRVRAGDYVQVQFARDEYGSKVVDNMQGSSNQLFPIAELRIEQCQN